MALDDTAGSAVARGLRATPRFSIEAAPLALFQVESGAVAERKARGAFFTPRTLCDYVVKWAVRDPADRVLEPSCGEAAFLLSAGTRLHDLGCASPSCGGQLHGVELHPESASVAGQLLGASGLSAEIDVGSFFDRQPEQRFDAVVGNPPYVRYHGFSGEARARSHAAAWRAGVRLSKLASSWAAFTVHAAQFLKPEGRLGLVLPAELLTVNYAAEVRRFLMARFARVQLVLFTERVFPGVQEEVVLLLAEGTGSTDRCELYQVANATELGSRELEWRSWKPDRPESKWTPSLIPTTALDAYLAVTRTPGFSCLRDWGDTTLGMVTGNNRYFALSSARFAELGLRSEDAIPLSPPGSRHLRGLALGRDDWSQMGRLGHPTLLFRPLGQPSLAAARYIALGEAMGVNEAYKCRKREPWWRVPYVPPPDVFVTYMNADAPRLCSNEAAVHHLNSVHGLFLHADRREVGRELLPIGALNSITLLGAETVGRSYGGGMLKLEPREADQLPVPDVDTLVRAADSLRAIRPAVAECLRSRDLQGAVRLVDQVLLVKELQLRPGEVADVESAHELLRQRRSTRSGPVR